MSDNFHCECDKGQPDKPCRMFDGNDELYSNSLLARQIAEILTNGGVAGVSVQNMCRDIMEYTQLIGEADSKISSMIDSLDGIKHPSFVYVKKSIQIANAMRKRSRLKRGLVELYRDLGKLVGVERETVSMGNLKRVGSC